MLKLDCIAKKIKNKTIISNFSLDVSNGEFIAITGPSGCGKTTLLNMIASIERLNSGRITYKDNLIDSKYQREFFKNELGYLFQNYGLVENKTVYENFKYYLRTDQFKCLTKVELNKKISEFGLYNINSNSYIYELSGGEQQRIALLRVFMKKPTIILADEPTGNLDEENESFIFKKLIDFKNEGNIVIIVSHSNSVRKYCDRLIHM